MSRSGYSDDCCCDSNWPWIMYRGAVKSSLRGKRGQAFLKEMLEAMDALPEKRLVPNELEQEGSYCALGTVGAKRGIDMKELDPEDSSTVANVFGIAEVMAREIVYMNDENCDYIYDELTRNYWPITPEERFANMRAWIVSEIKQNV